MSTASQDAVVQPRRRVQQGKNAGIAKVLRGAGPEHAGMGIVIDPVHILTCAHVVNVALGRQPDSTALPEVAAKLEISFPLLEWSSKRCGRVTAWRPFGDAPGDDVAVIELTEPAAKEVGIAIPADVVSMSPDGDILSVYGLSAHQQVGSHISARFKGTTSAGWVQIDSQTNTSFFIEGGFSGAAVWDNRQDAVLGMVVRRQLSEVQQIAYMIPVYLLRTVWPALQIEKRRLPRYFGSIWTLYAAASVSSSLLWHSVILAPALALMLLLQARDFRLHPWSYRVPSFGDFGAGPSWSRTRSEALANLVIFALTPVIYLSFSWLNGSWLYRTENSIFYACALLLFTLALFRVFKPAIKNRHPL